MHIFIRNISYFLLINLVLQYKILEITGKQRELDTKSNSLYIRSMNYSQKVFFFFKKTTLHNPPPPSMLIFNSIVYTS